MPRKNRQFGLITSARGPKGLRPATDLARPYGKPEKSLRSASNSRSFGEFRLNRARPRFGPRFVNQIGYVVSKGATIG